MTMLAKKLYTQLPARVVIEEEASCVIPGSLASGSTEAESSEYIGA
jgi:hypothetical protein